MTKKDSVVVEKDENLELSEGESTNSLEFSFLQNKRLSKKRILLKQLENLELPVELSLASEDEIFQQMISYSYLRIRRLMEKEGASSTLFTLLTGASCFEPYSAAPFRKWLIELDGVSEISIDTQLDRSSHDLTFSVMIDTEMNEYYESFETAPRCGCGKVFRIAPVGLPEGEGMFLPERGKIIWCSSPSAL